MALRVPLKWLQDYVEVKLPPQQLAERLTVAGLEVESVTLIGAGWHRTAVVVGQIRSVTPHPNADRLCLVEVDYGQAAPLTVVTGAPNLLRYRTEPLPGPLKVAFAGVGAELIDGHAEDGRTLKLKASNIRGVRSEGMVCSEKELGLSENHEGILLLPDDAPLGQALADYLGDAVLEFDIKGGFAHLMCIYGVAREVAALTGTRLRDDVLRAAGAAAAGSAPASTGTGAGAKSKATPKGKPKAAKPEARSASKAGPTAAASAGATAAATPYVQLEVTDTAKCPRYTVTFIEGITVQPSPFWLQQRLLRAGMRPINAVVDATNYVMLELGQPIHAFDYGTLRAEKSGALPLIRVRPAHAGERMHTLDGVERTFDEHMLLITDGGGPVGIAGVMGGLESEITEATRNVLLESASFEFLNTRRTSQLLKLRTEASDRFGKRLDPELALLAGLRCAQLIAELCGGTVHAQVGDLYPQPQAQPTIELRGDFVARLLGVEVPRAEIVRILRALEFQVAEGDPLRVTPPSHRMDVSIPADLVEEVGRIHGYDRMAPSLLRDELPPQQRNLALEGTEFVRDVLVGCGLDEIITYSLISLEDERRLHPERAPVDEAAYLRVRNPISAERAHLRRRLLAESLNAARANLRFGGRVAIFELGAVFLPRPGELLPAEPPRLCVLLTGPRDPASWLDGHGEAGFDFFDVKGVVETLLERLEVAGAAWDYGADAAYHPGRSAVLRLGGAPIGQLGELHPRVADAFGLPAQPVCAAELELDALLHAWREDREMTPLSTHPPVYEDLAFVVREGVAAEQVRALIAETGRPLVRDVALFDLYRGDPIAAGSKSLAYALTYQADDRTLTDDEVAKVRARIVKRLEKELEAQLRA
jgi:phenylalanyl-tRNA synthetase beta chain